MKSKKRLTIITFAISIVTLIAAISAGNYENPIIYDISMALMGSAILGFIMSITEYYVERRKAMEEFWQQALMVLKGLRKIKYLDLDAPVDLILSVFNEERSNNWNQLMPDGNEVCHEARNRLIAWHEERHQFSYEESIDVNFESELYNEKLHAYKETFEKCMDSYRKVSSIDLKPLKNAYENLDFIFVNKSIRQKANNIYDRLNKIIQQFRSDSNHFNLMKDSNYSFPSCAAIVAELNHVYFTSKIKKEYSQESKLIFQSVFDEIDSSLEEFRCKIYRTRYSPSEPEPVLGKIIYFKEDKPVRE